MFQIILENKQPRQMKICRGQSLFSAIQFLLSVGGLDDFSAKNITHFLGAFFILGDQTLSAKRIKAAIPFSVFL